MKSLPTIIIDGVKYFIDKRLNQIRNINNPHDWDMVSPEIINYWLENNIEKV